MTRNRKSEHGVEHITRGSGNVFEDLGFSAAESAALLSETDAAIRQKLSLRLDLAQVVNNWMDEEKLKQEDAAVILKISRPRVSDLRRQKITKFSVDSLIDIVGRTGKKVHLEIA